MYAKVQNLASDCDINCAHLQTSQRKDHGGTAESFALSKLNLIKAKEMICSSGFSGI